MEKRFSFQNLSSFKIIPTSLNNENRFDESSENNGSIKEKSPPSPLLTSPFRSNVEFILRIFKTLAKHVSPIHPRTAPIYRTLPLNVTRFFAATETVSPFTIQLANFVHGFQHPLSYTVESRERRRDNHLSLHALRILTNGLNLLHESLLRNDENSSSPPPSPPYETRLWTSSNAKKRKLRAIEKKIHACPIRPPRSSFLLFCIREKSIVEKISTGVEIRDISFHEQFEIEKEIDRDRKRERSHATFRG